MKARILIVFISSIFIIAIFLSSCATKNKAERYYRNHPLELAIICAQTYPVTEKYIKGDTITKTDTVTLEGLILPCPEPETNTVTGKIKTVFVKCPPQKTIYKTNTVTDTVIKENTAYKASLLGEITVLNTEKEKLKKELEESKSLARTRLFLLISVGILLLVSVWFGIRRVF